MSDPITRLNEALEDRYRIERKIGEGGMASVYLAEDLKHERQVALKILRPELAAVLGAERFLAEIKTTANLQHPHILPLFDSGEADGFLYYVMPYIAGENVRDRVEAEGQLGVDEAVEIARDVGDALDYAHRNDIIHRDIKPANILLHDGNPLVADFGIALAVSAAGGGRMTETGLSLGTPHYMSPEQASADRDLNARSDVYSLGCVLYEMLAGHPPHTGPSAQSVLVRILTEDPRPVSEVRRSVPPHVAAAVTRAIEKLPADRFESARDFVDALGDPGFTYVAAPRTATGTRAPSASARPRSPLTALLPWAMAAVFAVFAALAGWSMLSAPESVPVTSAAEDLQGRVLTTWGGDFAVAPNGTAFAVSHLPDGWTDFNPRIDVRRAGERDYRTLTEAGMALGPVFSPSGDQIVYSSRSGGLMKISISGGAPQPVVLKETPGPGLAPLDWGDDGSILFDNRTEIAIVPSTGGEPRGVYDGHAWSGQILPGGNLVLGVSQFDDPGVRFVDTARDTSWVLVPEGIQPRYANGHLLWADEDGTVWASGFDPATGALDEDRSIVLEGVTMLEDRHARYDVSENGTLVYSMGGSLANDDQSRRLVTVTLDGDTIVETLDPREIQYPAWSSDGRYVAWAGGEPGADSDDDQIYVYDMRVKDRPEPLTRGGRNSTVVWSPDGTRIAFRSEREGSEDGNIHVMDVEGSGPPTRLLELEGPQWPYDWISPGRMLIQHEGDPWILELPDPGSADTVVVRRFFRAEDFNRKYRVDRRGELVTYSSLATGDFEVYVRTFPDPGSPVKVSEGGGFNPHWSPDGETIYYFRPMTVDGSAQLWAARIDRGPPVAVTGLDSVMVWPDGIDARSADLHPDGDRFIGVLEGDGTGPDEVRYFIVTNWFEEMRERLGRGG